MTHTRPARYPDEIFDIVLTQCQTLDIVLGAHNTMSDIGPRQYQCLEGFNDVSLSSQQGIAKFQGSARGASLGPWLGG